MRKTKLIACLVLLPLFTGCQLARWQPAGIVHGASDTFTVRVPDGWMYFENPPGNIVATQDGLLLQHIIVNRRDLKEPLPVSKRVLTRNLTPYELAEALADNLRADHHLLELAIIKNEPADLGGLNGFKLLVSYHTSESLGIKECIVGAIAEDHLYTLVFAAPQRYYFDRDEKAFEEAVRSFKIAER
jgi:hypothetical protein